MFCGKNKFQKRIYVVVALIVYGFLRGLSLSSRSPAERHNKMKRGIVSWKDTMLTMEKHMPLLKAAPTMEKQCSAFIMTAGFPSMKRMKSSFTNGQNIYTETRLLEHHMDISAQIVTASALLSRFNLSAVLVGLSTKPTSSRKRQNFI